MFYRASAQQEARRLGIRGHARNLWDGRVEVLACGEPEKLERLRAWLAEGPPGARVEKVEYKSVTVEVQEGFTTG